MADVSRNVVAVLLVLVILVSGLGTWNLLSTRAHGGVSGLGQSDATVSLFVQSPPPRASVQLTVQNEATLNG